MIRIQAFSPGDRSRTYFSIIDITKLVCAVLVVAIHIPPLGTACTGFAAVIQHVIQNVIGVFAVPFFFLCTGFLVFRKTDGPGFSPHRPLRHAHKLFRLYILWSVLYAPLTAEYMIQAGMEAADGAVWLLRNFLLIGSYRHLWYVNTSVLALLLITFLLHRGAKPSRIAAAALCLYVLGRLTQHFSLSSAGFLSPALRQALHPVETLLSLLSIGFFRAFLFISLGMLLARGALSLTMGRSLTGFAVSSVLLAAELLLLYALGCTVHYSLYLFLVPTSFFLFSVIARMDIQPERDFSPLRTTSSIIFFIHFWIDNILRKLYSRAGIASGETPLQFLSTLILCLLISAAVIRASENRRFRWLRRLYS